MSATEFPANGALTWKRHPETGAYTSGPYVIEKSFNGQWHLSGPSLNEPHFTKREAQRSAYHAARQRIDGHAMCAVPVVGDHVETTTDVRKVTLPARPGQITSVIETGNGPLYCIKFARGKRLCLFRNEFKVVMP
ncbi:hypothetical protein SEA_RAWRGERTHAT_93 [Mycobacterium phage RawrgerThat]|nr:hypothetical protein SEA_RAWRGERTHAT_93 [Mycobacterium phage RawrgerThat]